MAIEPYPLPPCGRPGAALPPRLAASALLILLLVRLLSAARHGNAPWTLATLAIACALCLGVCLWWVANRQVGGGGAAVALGLYCTLPLRAAGVPVNLVRDGLQSAAALGLFSMVFTAVGVAHALQGPRRKWPKRIALMGALTVFTALAQPFACAAGLLLSLIAMVYLGENRRRLLPFFFAFWLLLAALPGLLHPTLQVWKFVALDARNVAAPPSPMQWSQLWPCIGMILAAVVGLVLWISASRSRYFGNTAPLTAGVLLCAAGVAGISGALFWALPFVLAFVAGTFADALESRARVHWAVGATALCVLQMALGWRA